MLKLPDLNLDIIDIASESRAAWAERTERVRRVGTQGGISSNHFQECCEKILQIVGHRELPLATGVTTPIDIRACTYLWLEDDDFFRSTKVDSSTLGAFRQIKPKQSLITLLNLTRLYLKRFDDCGDVDALAAFINIEFRLRDGDALAGDLRKLADARDQVFHRHGYEILAEKARSSDRNLDAVLTEAGISGKQTGRFQELSAGVYYLRQLKQMVPEKSSSLLAEVTRADICSISYHKKLLGHSVIETLVARVVELRIELPKQWLDAILVIAGDPRTPLSSDNYVKWWSQIDPRCLALVRESLSGVDLNLFLKILDDVSKRSKDKALKRMFPKRQIFLKGLHESKLIRHSRLFVSEEADRYLRKNYQESELPSYATLGDKTTSVIYLALDNAHIVEGSHNHRFWIYDKLPKSSDILDYEEDFYYRAELSKDLQELYQETYKNKDFPWFTNHVPRWQSKVIEQLRHMRVQIDPEKVLDREDYVEFRRTHGV